MYRYPTPNIQEKDITWRSKCSLCQLIDPTTYGVLPEYAFGGKAKVKANSTNSTSITTVSSPPSAESVASESVEHSEPNGLQETEREGGSVTITPTSTSTSVAPEITPEIVTVTLSSSSSVDVSESQANSSTNPESVPIESVTVAVTTSIPDNSNTKPPVSIPGSFSSSYSSYHLVPPFATGTSNEEKSSSDYRSVSVAEAREQLRSASTDQFKTIFSHIAFPAKRTASTTILEDDDESLGESRVRGIGVGDYDARFAQLLDGPSFDAPESPMNAIPSSHIALDFISKYNKRGDMTDESAPLSDSTMISSIHVHTNNATSSSSSGSAERSSSRSKSSSSSSSAAPTSTITTTEQPSHTSGTVAHLMKDSIPFSESNKKKVDLQKISSSSYFTILHG